MTKPIASLSLDLDNKWAYLRTLGDASWDRYPSYLDVVVPRVLRCCADRGLRLTCFVIGRDAERHENRDALGAIAAAGHEIGNHSLNHYPWMHTFRREQIEAEICAAEEQIERATGQQTFGFRGPGYSFSPDILEVLVRRGYQYDATTLPTFIGPLARWYVCRNSSKEAAKRSKDRELLGSWRDGLRPLKPYLCHTAAGAIVEIPVTTFPLAKLPIHTTYLAYLWQASPRLAKLYVRAAMTACRVFGVRPSILLHPLDFLGAEDEADLRMLPGMNLPRAEKAELVDGLLNLLTAQFDVVTMSEHASQVAPNWVAGVERRDSSADLGARLQLDPSPPSYAAER